MQLSTSFPIFQKDLYDAAKRGDVTAVRRLIASCVSVDCTPYQVLYACSIMSLLCTCDNEHYNIKQAFNHCPLTVW